MPLNIKSIYLKYFKFNLPILSFSESGYDEGGYIIDIKSTLPTYLERYILLPTLSRHTLVRL